MPETQVRWGLVAIGAGVAVVGGWLWYSEYAKQKLVEEYIDEMHELQAFYKAASADGMISEGEWRIIGDMEQAMSTKEKLLESEGLIPTVLRRLAQLGIIITAGYIAAKIVNWLLKKFPPGPPNFTCTACGTGPFPTQSTLEEHVRTAHGVDPAMAEAGYNIFRQLSPWLQNLVAAWSGALDWVYQNWRWVAIGVLVAIAIACILLIIFSGGTLAPALAPVAAALLV